MIKSAIAYNLVAVNVICVIAAVETALTVYQALFRADWQTLLHWLLPITARWYHYFHLHFKDEGTRTQRCLLISFQGPDRLSPDSKLWIWAWAAFVNPSGRMRCGWRWAQIIYYYKQQLHVLRKTRPLSRPSEIGVSLIKLTDINAYSCNLIWPFTYPRWN